MIGIVDYGLGNLTSVEGAVRHLGHEATVTSDPAVLAKADKLILPGVGAFGDGMRNLRERGLVEPLTEMVKGAGKPILGICLGFQLIARDSEEFGHHEGLGWVDGSVLRLAPADEDLRIPHVGWNDLIRTADCAMFDGLPDDALVLLRAQLPARARQIRDRDRRVRLRRPFRRRDPPGQHLGGAVPSREKPAERAAVAQELS